MTHCANPDCPNKFDQVKHNQKYCTPECCKIVTNAALMRDYYNKKARLAGKPRVCTECNTTKLSRYNETEICSECVAKHKANKRDRLVLSLGM